MTKVILPSTKRPVDNLKRHAGQDERSLSPTSSLQQQMPQENTYILSPPSEQAAAAISLPDLPDSRLPYSHAALSPDTRHSPLQVSHVHEYSVHARRYPRHWQEHISAYQALKSCFYS